MLITPAQREEMQLAIEEYLNSNWQAELAVLLNENALLTPTEIASGKSITSPRLFFEISEPAEIEEMMDAVIAAGTAVAANENGELPEMTGMLEVGGFLEESEDVGHAEAAEEAPMEPVIPAPPEMQPAEPAQPAVPEVPTPEPAPAPVMPANYIWILGNTVELALTNRTDEVAAMDAILAWYYSGGNYVYGHYTAGVFGILNNAYNRGVLTGTLFKVVMDGTVHYYRIADAKVYTASGASWGMASFIKGDKWNGFGKAASEHDLALMTCYGEDYDRDGVVDHRLVVFADLIY